MEWSFAICTRALGRINLDGGDLIFNGDRFILNGGTIQFVNPSQTQPVVNLALNTTIQEYLSRAEQNQATVAE